MLNAGSLGDAPVIAKVGAWSVHRDTDSFTDKVTCTAIYKQDYSVQMSASEMYISERGRGGVQAITLRFDDDPPERMQLASDVEKDVSAIAIKDADFERLLTARRLRYQILRVVNGMDEGDLNLTGFAAAHDVVVGPKCGH